MADIVETDVETDLKDKAQRFINRVRLTHESSTATIRGRFNVPEDLQQNISDLASSITAAFNKESLAKDFENLLMRFEKLCSRNGFKKIPLNLRPVIAQILFEEWMQNIKAFTRKPRNLIALAVYRGTTIIPALTAKKYANLPLGQTIIKDAVEKYPEDPIAAIDKFQSDFDRLLAIPDYAVIFEERSTRLAEVLRKSSKNREQAIKKFVDDFNDLLKDDEFADLNLAEHPGIAIHIMIRNYTDPRKPLRKVQTTVRDLRENPDLVCARQFPYLLLYLAVRYLNEALAIMEDLQKSYDALRENPAKSHLSDSALIRTLLDEKKLLAAPKEREDTLKFDCDSFA